MCEKERERRERDRKGGVSEEGLDFPRDTLTERQIDGNREKLGLEKQKKLILPPNLDS